MNKTRRKTKDNISLAIYALMLYNAIPAVTSITPPSAFTVNPAPVAIVIRMQFDIPKTIGSIIDRKYPLKCPVKFGKSISSLKPSRKMYLVAIHPIAGLKDAR